jgi:hypothetical protein
MYAIYGNIYHQYTPVMLAYIPAPWIRHGIGIKFIKPIHFGSDLDPEAAKLLRLTKATKAMTA